MREINAASFPSKASEMNPVVQPDMPMVRTIYNYLGCKNLITLKFISIVVTAITVFDWKQTNYGEKNIARKGAAGITTRLFDKVFRLENIYDTGKFPEDETVEDTFGDIGVYGFMGLMCRYGWWPGSPESKAIKT